MNEPESRPQPPVNRLAGEASPYLRQHARNPVDWHPWGPEAFEKARREDKPVFLSVGYSACHWCHVMAHESFEDDDVAAALNRFCVCVKVDREERPDIDDLYMKATQLMTGRGGWPNSVWLLPDGRPWYAGTYFPRDDRPPAIGFLTLLDRLAGLWRERRADVEEQAARLHAAIRRFSESAPAGGAVTAVAPGADAIRRAERELGLAFDDEHGGFGDAPKFPPCGDLSLLLERERRVPDPERRRMIRTTLDAMALGGMRDHVGGGFHRYSTDARWLRPHFEKMLYDNARLARVYADAATLWDDSFYAEAARDALDWALREMTSPEGGFYSALDADSEGGEGRFYVWALADLRAALGPERAGAFGALYRCREAGNYEDEATGTSDGTNILHLGSRPDDTTRAERRTDLETLRRARDARPRPGLDDKILASWNGLTIGSLAHAGLVLGEPRYVEAARRAADHLWGALHRDGRLLHQVAGGRASLNGYLDDYTAMACGLLDLHEASGDPAWLERAGELMVSAWDHFHDTDRGGFFFTSDDHETLIDRARDSFDGATPSGSGLAALALVRLHRLTHSALYRVMAEETLLAGADLMDRAPRGVSTLLLALAGAIEAGVFETAAERPPSVDATWRGRTVGAAAGREFEAVLSVRVAEGWHIDARGADGSPGLRVGMEPHPSIRLAAVGFPADRMGAGLQDVAVRFAVADGTPAGLHELRVTVTIRPCTETECAPDIRRELSLNVRIGPAAEDDEEECGGG